MDTTTQEITPDTQNRYDDLAQLVAEARSGHQSACTTLVEQLDPMVRSVARRGGVSPQDLDDVSQDVWTQVVANLHRLREDRAFVGWLCTITRNAALSTLRTTSRAVPTEDVDALPYLFVEDDTVVGAGVEREECVRAVRSGLAQLAPRQRDLLLMVAAEPPVPYRLISTRLGMPIGSIGPTRARLLRRLAAVGEVSGLVGRHSSAIAS